MLANIAFSVGVDAFITFWQALVATQSLPMPLRLYGAVVLLASPSSCDSERAISTPNRIVTVPAQRNELAHGSVAFNSG